MVLGPEIRVRAYSKSGQSTNLLLSNKFEPSLVNDAFPSFDEIRKAAPFVTTDASVGRLKSLSEQGSGSWFYDHMLTSKAGIYWPILGEDGNFFGITGYDYSRTLPKSSPKSFNWILDPSAQNRGIGRAAARARTNAAFKYDKVETMRSEIDIRNIPSYKVVRSLGGVCIAHEIRDGVERHNLVTLNPLFNNPMPSLHHQEHFIAQVLTLAAARHATRDIMNDPNIRVAA